MSYASEVLADSPVLFLRLEETSGTSCADSSGNGLTATTHGTVTRNVASLTSLGIGVTFGGTTSDYINIPDNSLLDVTGDVTYECWIKTPTGTTQTLMQKAYNQALFQNGGYWLRLEPDGSLSFRESWNGTVLVSSTVPIPSNVWTHIAVTRNGNNYVIYINGIVRGTATNSHTMLATDGQFVVGVGNDYSGGLHYAEPVLGSMDEVAVYASGLSSSRITTHYGVGSATLYTQTLSASVSTIATVKRSHATQLVAAVSIVPSFSKVFTRLFSVIAGIVPTAGRFRTLDLPVTSVSTHAVVGRPNSRFLSAQVTPAATIANTGTPPVPIGYSVTGYSAIVEFDGDLSTNDPTESKFAFTVDGVAKTITNAQPTGSLLYLYFAGPVANGKVAQLIYTPGSGGTKLIGASGFPVAAFTLTDDTVVADDSGMSLVTHGGFNDLTH